MGISSVYKYSMDPFPGLFNQAGGHPRQARASLRHPRLIKKTGSRGPMAGTGPTLQTEITGPRGSGRQIYFLRP